MALGDIMQTESEKALAELAEEGGVIYRVLAKMHADNRDTSGLDLRTYLLVRLAALVAVDAAPTSYLVNFAMGDEADLTIDEVRGVIVAVAPLVGSTRVVSAMQKAEQALRIGQGR
jgi:alkylhydroperoxidase/carboxymuconolactone decarboxylase family protein YurZ